MNGEDLSSLLNLGATFTDAPGGTANWSFAGNINYKSANGAAAITITRATAAITVAPYSVTYNGNTHTAAGSATGVGGVDLSASLTLSNTTHINAGDYAADAWSFSGGTNYNDASGTGRDCSKKANATITVTPYSVTYDGAAHTATGSALGVNSESLSGLDLSHTTNTNAGTYSTDYWTFTDSTGNYNNVANTAITDSIAKADATIKVTPYSVTYDGNSHTATGTATGVGGTDLSATLTLSNTMHTSAGAYSDAWSFSGGANYNDANGVVNDSIAKGSATFNVSGYSGVYDANSHGATGSAKGVKGEDLSTLLNLGGSFTDVTGGTAHWTFAGDTNYNAAAGDASIVLTQAQASITVNGYTGVYDGNAHGASGTVTGVKGEDLSSLLSLGATFTSVPGGTANWSFAGNTDYKPAFGSVSITINKSSSYTTVSVAGGASFTYDSLPHPATVSVISVGVSLTPLPVYSPCGHAPVNVADSGCVASYTYAGDANHFSSSDSKTYSITPAALSVTANNQSMTLNGTFPALTGTLTGVLGADGITATYTTAATGAAVGSFPITPVPSDPNGKLPNYTVTKNNGTLTVLYGAVGMCDGDYGHQILQPVNADGTSTFKQGSTAPAKFRVCDAQGNSIGTPGMVAGLYLIGIKGGTVIQTVDEAVVSTTPDQYFRWDSTGQQWIFNISTSNLSKNNTYYYQITLNDGSNIAFRYGLPK